jgi:HSP20 family protein
MRRFVMTLMRPRVFPEGPTLRDAIDRLFDESFVSPREWLTVDRRDKPAIDAYTTPDAFVVRAALPGVKPEDIHTTITGDVLTIDGKFREETKREEEGYLYRELSRSELRRTIGLPAGLKTEAAQASFADGILTLTVPKAETALPREIKVKAA